MFPISKLLLPPASVIVKNQLRTILCICMATRCIHFHIISSLFLVLIRVLYISGSESSKIVSRIAFGSCANQSAPQPIWNAINQFDPHLFIWLGDNIYGDNKHPFKIFGKKRTIGPWKNVPRFFAASKEEMEKKYALAKHVPGYAELRQRSKVIGTWDDHDYGLNDAGRELRDKNTNQKLLLDFLDEPEDSARRKQAGVYTSYMFGPAGKRIKVILLDTRYHRDPLNSDGTILGEAQWKWLQKELSGRESQITIIASSIQVISNLSATTGPLFYMESWGRFPKERKRLFEMITNSKRNGIFFISGDVHFGEITRYDRDYSLYDITSSGLTQAVEKAVSSPLAFLVRVAARLTPNTMRVYSRKCQYKSCTYGQPNFGAIEIHWDTIPQIIKIEVRDVHGNPTMGVDIKLSELQSGNALETCKGGQKTSQQHCTLEIDLPWIVRHRLAFLFFGAALGLVGVLILLIILIISVTRKLCLLKCKNE